MDIGVVFQCDPPASAVVELARKAEDAGFSHVWTFDSHLLWQEPFVIYSAILAATERVMVGPMVTNPGTRDWTVNASHFATLKEMYGNRTVCGNGRAVEYKGSTLRLPWATRSRVEVWVAGYGPKALQLTGEVADGFILQLADPDITAWTIGSVRRAA
ncbi:MAG: LLM class flavin-dependent oxidoreductase, partial [Nocardioidaceae bacterium]